MTRAKFRVLPFAFHHTIKMMTMLHNNANKNISAD